MSELKRLKETFDGKMGDAKKWIADPNAPPGGEGEKRAREAWKGFRCSGIWSQSSSPGKLITTMTQSL